MPISLNCCIPWSKTLEVASFSTAVRLQYANACLLWGLQDSLQYSLLLLAPCQAEPHHGHAAPLLGCLTSICQKMLARESPLLRLRGSGPQLQDPNLVCATQYTKTVPPLDPVHCRFTCWKKSVICMLV